MSITFETWAYMQFMGLLTPLFSMLIKTSAKLEFLSVTLLHDFSTLCFSNRAYVISIRSTEYFSIIIYLRVVILVSWMQSRAHRAESRRLTTTHIWFLEVFVICFLRWWWCFALKQLRIIVAFLGCPVKCWGFVCMHLSPDLYSLCYPVQWHTECKSYSSWLTWLRLCFFSINEWLLLE